MKNKSKLSVILSLSLGVFILITGNHCIFEIVYVSVAQQVFGAEEPKHLLHHIGSGFPHKHSDDSEPHRHGQPPTIFAINLEKSLLDFSKTCISYLFLLVVNCFGYFAIKRLPRIYLPLDPEDPPRPMGNFISSLTLAPQAPPA